MLKGKKLVDTPSVREQITDIIRKMIVSGELESGQQLVERELGEQLNVSTTPVKETFRILESEGLIYTIPRKGSFVSEFAKSNLEQNVYVRSALEGTAAYFATKNLTNNEIKNLQQILVQSGKSVLENKIDELSEYNTSFHTIIRNASRNEYLIKLILNMRSIDKTIREVSLNKNLEEPVRAHQEHTDILKAIQERDSDLAERLTVNHIRRVVQFVVNKD